MLAVPMEIAPLPRNVLMNSWSVAATMPAFQETTATMLGAPTCALGPTRSPETAHAEMPTTATTMLQASTPTPADAAVELEAADHLTLDGADAVDAAKLNCLFFFHLYV